MSRAYRIRVKESILQDVSAHDEIRARLEILQILPPAETVEILRRHLEARGFTPAGEVLTKTRDGIIVVVDPASQEVTVRAEAAESLSLESEQEAWGYDDVGPRPEDLRQKLEARAREELQRRLAQRQDQLQRQATTKLEAVRGDVQRELNDVVNAVIRDALKRRAAQLGEIKELTEDPEAGSLTIKIAV